MESGEANPDTIATAPVVTETPPPTVTAVTAPAQPAAQEIARYEFPPQSLLNDGELRRITADYNEILEVAARRFASLFRTEFEFSLASLQTPTYRHYVSAHQQPTHFTLLKIEPLRGIGIIETNPAFALAVTERLMGGPGQPDTAQRNLTEIETALFDQVAQLFLQTWCEHWAIGKQLKPALIGHENDPRYLQTSPAEAPLLVATVNAHLGDACSKIQFALPFTTIEPILEKIRAELAPPADAAAPAKPAAARGAAWNPIYDEVRVAISAQMPGPVITARELPKLKVGDLLDLPGDSASQVQLSLGNTARFTGRLGKCDDNWAVEVVQVLKS